MDIAYIPIIIAATVGFWVGFAVAVILILLVRGRR